MSDHKLDVPYYRQVDIKSGLNSYLQNRSCGILALKMVLDYYRLNLKKPTLDLAELFEKALKNGGTNGIGDWYHSTLVKTAIDYGFKSWRRSWRPADRDKDFFRSEGVNENSIALWEEQTKAESIPSLVSSVKKKCPVIVSVAKNFEMIDKNHDVVLVGFKMNKNSVTGLYFHDPYAVPTGKDNKDLYVPLDKFNGKWTYRAIFVEV